jgi:hypothetical protein
MASTSLRREGPPTGGDRCFGFDLRPRKRSAFRLSRHKAIQIHAWSIFLATKDHSSSNSKVVEAGLVASGVLTVSLEDGSSAAFFHPGHHRLARDPKRPLQPVQAPALFLCPEELFTTFLRVGMRGCMCSALPLTGTAELFLLPIERSTVAYKCIALTIRTLNGDRYHGILPLSTCCRYSTTSFSF